MGYRPSRLPLASVFSFSARSVHKRGEFYHKSCVCCHQKCSKARSSAAMTICQTPSGIFHKPDKRPTYFENWSVKKLCQIPASVLWKGPYLMAKYLLSIHNIAYLGEKVNQTDRISVLHKPKKTPETEISEVCMRLIFLLIISWRTAERDGLP